MKNFIAGVLFTLIVLTAVIGVAQTRLTTVPAIDSIFLSMDQSAMVYAKCMVEDVDGKSVPLKKAEIAK